MKRVFPKSKLRNTSLATRLVGAILLYFGVANIALLKAEPSSQEHRQLLQLIEYIGVDYPAAVNNGKVLDQGEYQEMSDFASIIADKSKSFTTQQASLASTAQKLQEAVEKKQSTNKIQALTAELKHQLLANSPQLSLPKTLLPYSEVRKIFQSNCSSCHGLEGKGDGVMAKTLSPAPTDFTNKERAINRSIMGLYNVISGGLDGTAMPAFSQFNNRQRWSLAFQVGSLAFTGTKGSNISQEPKRDLSSNVSLSDIISYSPKEIIRQNREFKMAQVEHFRASPDLLFMVKQDPFATAQIQLAASLIAYQEDDLVGAKNLAVSAYLDGFELVENGLDAHDKSLRKNIEGKMLSLRRSLSKADNEIIVQSSVRKISELLNQAKKLVTESSMSDTTLFSASFIILLREGLEALLVIIALFTILVRSKKTDAVRYLHFGWITALFVGALTWIIAQYFVAISGASREVMEGGAALVAAVILFYVGFWMHNKSRAGQWQEYIQKNIEHSLSTGTLWGIFSLSFISVYREVFETVLFYQSLLTQAGEAQRFVLVSGFAFAVLGLLLIAWLFVKYSIKLPVARFFSVTTYFLLILSFILIGKAVSALQEAAIIGISPFWIDFQVDWLGIKSTWQGLMAQISILILSSGLVFQSWFKKNFNDRAAQLSGAPTE